MRRILPVLAAVLACAACAVPVFDPAMSAAVAAFRASHVIGASHPTTGPDMNTDGKPDFDLTEDTLVYLPERWDGVIDPSRGFVVRHRSWDNWNEIWYQWWDGSTVKWMDSPAGYNEEEGLRWRWPASVKGGPYLGAIAFEWSDLDTYVERLYANTGSGTCDWFSSFDLGVEIDADVALITGEPVVVGLSLNPLVGLTDRLHALVRDGALFSEVEADVNGSGGAPAFAASVTPNAYTLPFLTTPRHVNYARDTDNARSFVQWIDDDAWRTGAWKGTVGTGAIDFHEPAGIDHRIDAVLTTDPIWGWAPGSYLFSTEKQIGRIYHYNGPGTGSLVAEFGLGTLYFVGEVMLGGEWQLVFTRSLVDRTVNPARIRFEVRGIYVKDLLNTFGL